MTIRGARDLSVPVLLALLGAALCVGSLFMNWLKIDLAAVEHWMQTSPELTEARAQSSMTPAQLHAAMEAMLGSMMHAIGSRLSGLHVLKVWMVATQLIAAGVVVLAVARFMNSGGTRARLAAELLGAGAVLSLRAAWMLVHVPQSDAVRSLVGADIFVAGPGVYVALLGGLLVVGSGVWAQRAAAAGLDARERAEQDQAEFMARTGGGGLAPAPAFAGAVQPAVPAPYMPTVPQQASMPPQQASMPPQPAYAPQQPTYAPQQQAYMPPPPAYAPQQQAYTPPPPAYARQPFAAPPAPVPAPPTQPPADPGSSVAPPGFS